MRLWCCTLGGEDQKKGGGAGGGGLHRGGRGGGLLHGLEGLRHEVAVVAHGDIPPGGELQRAVDD